MIAIEQNIFQYMVIFETFIWYSNIPLLRYLFLKLYGTKLSLSIEIIQIYTNTSQCTYIIYYLLSMTLYS
jgi:hypothetical protein